MDNKVYELTVILPEQVSEKELKELVEAWLKRVGGTVKSFAFWGKKELAYPIKKQGRGIYGYWELEMKGSESSELMKRMRLDEKVLRYLLVVKNKRIKEASPKLK